MFERYCTHLTGLQAKVIALRELQSTSGDELSALMPSVLDRKIDKFYFEETCIMSEIKYEIVKKIGVLSK